MSHRSLEDVLVTAESPVELLRNAKAGPNVYPGVPPEFTNWRDEQRAWQESCVLFNLSYHMNDLAVEGPDAMTVALPPRGQQLRRVHRRPGQALRAVQPRRLRHRRRHPVRARKRAVRPGRPGSCAQLDHVPRGDRRVRRDCRSRPEERASHGRTPQVVPVPGAGAECDAGDREGPRRDTARARVLPHDSGDDRGKNRGRSAARHGRAAGLGALRTVGRRGGRARGARDGRRGVRSPAGGRTRVLVQHARVGMDSVAPSCRVLGRGSEGLPGVAAGDRDTRPPPSSVAASSRRTSRTTTSRRGISGTGVT